ncbi:MAG TPA: hypothetical protein DCS93_09100 [Microscillaceae bacterium]|nr:hypothetical protein [Microscillaceae bacterium]
MNFLMVLITKNLNFTLVKNFLLPLFTVVFTLNVYAQKVVGPHFSLQSGFVKYSSDKKIALGKINSADEKGYVFFVYHKLVDFSKSLIDTSRLTLEIQSYRLRSYGKKSWMDQDKFELSKTKIQPKTTDKHAVLVSFFLPNALASDVKGKLLSGLKFINRFGRNGVMARGTQPTRTAKSFFVTYANRIGFHKGSFENTAKYKSKPIVLYSLLEKTKSVVETKLGKHATLKTLGRGTTKASYQTAQAKYEIEYEGEKAIRIVCYPIPRFKFVDYLFIEYKYPIEITGCNCGAFTSKKYSDTVVYYFRDKASHTIRFEEKGRFLEKIIVDN